ncbi:hypothetical protein BJX96DRAFT_170524 [Aspergillus floccosus]
MSSTATPGSPDAGERTAPSNRTDDGGKKQKPSSWKLVEDAEQDAKMRATRKDQQEKGWRRMGEETHSDPSEDLHQRRSYAWPYPHLPANTFAGRQNKQEQPPAIFFGPDKRGEEPLPARFRSRADEYARLKECYEHAGKQKQEFLDMAKAFRKEIQALKYMLEAYSESDIDQKMADRLCLPAGENVGQEHTEHACTGARDNVGQEHNEHPRARARACDRVYNHASKFAAVAIYYLLMLFALYRMPRDSPSAFVTGSSCCIVMFFLTLPFMYLTTVPKQS